MFGAVSVHHGCAHCISLWSVHGYVHAQSLLLFALHCSQRNQHIGADGSLFKIHSSDQVLSSIATKFAFHVISTEALGGPLHHIRQQQPTD